MRARNQWGAVPIVALACVGALVALVARVEAQPSASPSASDQAVAHANEPTVRVQWLDYREHPDARTPFVDRTDSMRAGSVARTSAGIEPIPWWRSVKGRAQLLGVEDETAMRTAAGEWLEQPIAVYAPLVTTLRIEGRVEGNGTVFVTDGKGGRLVCAVGEKGKRSAFAVDAEDLARAFGRPASPRMGLRLAPGKEPGGEHAKDEPTAEWSHVEAWSELPCPSEAALRAEIVAEIDAIFTTWFTRAIDDVGPHKTGFLAKLFDAVTGGTLVVPRTTGFSSMYQALLDATQVEDAPAWHAYLAHLLQDYLDLQLHPDTGLPRNWDTQADVPDDTTPVEIALPLGFLIDVADHGPKEFRDRARAAALKIGDTVLRKGQMPDGTCAASYVPRDGTPNLDVSQLRRLDVPLQLVRLTRLTGDAKYAKAAREPLATLEFTNRWAGTWSAIDPGFDDDFGHYGARATAAALGSPDEKTFRRFALEGWKHYDPIWRDALRYGGNVAADQVRCWKIGVEIARLDPSLRTDMAALLWMAARSHFKGEQYDNGAWGDVTIFDYKPQTTLQVGDLPGAPQNLLTGLASIYVGELGLRNDEIRGMYTAVLRSSIAQYKKQYGFIAERAERKGANPATGSLRMLTGLVEMLRALSQMK